MKKLVLFAASLGIALLLGSPAMAAKKVNWQVGHTGPASHWEMTTDQKLADHLKKITNGGFTLTLYPGGSLYKGPDSLDAVSDNLAQKFGVWGSHVAGEEQVMELFDLPLFVPWDFDFRVKLWKTMTPMFRKLLLKRYNVYLVGIVQAEPRMIYTKKKVASLAELKGQKIRAMGPVETEFTQAIGAVPVPVNWSETYTALQQGLVDGNWVADAPHYYSKLYEVTNYIFDIGSAGAGHFVLVSQKALDALPPEYRKAFMDSMDQHMEDLRMGTYHGAKDGRQLLLKTGMKAVPVPASDMARMRKEATPIMVNWAKRLDPESHKIFEKAKAMIDEYNAMKKS